MREKISELIGHFERNWASVYAETFVGCIVSQPQGRKYSSLSHVVIFEEVNLQFSWKFHFPFFFALTSASTEYVSVPIKRR